MIELDGVAIGKAGFWRKWEVGDILDPAHRHKGMMYETLTALIAEAHARAPSLTATAEIDPRNTASARLSTRIGFRETHRTTKTLQIGDEWCDSAYFALHPADFRG